ncbi:hypothetical protein FB451DRAFT_1191829 [Mycena latifolia]|nr:hypothetical protein FB451DRAFT_1191829 [Mycena latifolia]
MYELVMDPRVRACVGRQREESQGERGSGPTGESLERGCGGTVAATKSILVALDHGGMKSHRGSQEPELTKPRRQARGRDEETYRMKGGNDMRDMVQDEWNPSGTARPGSRRKASDNRGENWTHGAVGKNQVDDDRGLGGAVHRCGGAWGVRQCPIENHISKATRASGRRRLELSALVALKLGDQAGSVLSAGMRGEEVRRTGPRELHRASVAAGFRRTELGRRKDKLEESLSSFSDAPPQERLRRMHVIYFKLAAQAPVPP